MTRLLAPVAMAALVALAMGGCSSTIEAEPAPSYPPIATSPPAPAPPPPPKVAAAEPAPDQCGAAALQALVGHLRSEIPVPLQPDRQRVACTTCPSTMDFRPDRLNFLFDADTGVIRKISCG